LRAEYDVLLFSREVDGPAWDLVKAADAIAAHPTCVEEAKAGNEDSGPAEQTTAADLTASEERAVRDGVESFVPHVGPTFDAFKARRAHVHEHLSREHEKEGARRATWAGASGAPARRRLTARNIAA
jgi:hypothetical protein